MFALVKPAAPADPKSQPESLNGFRWAKGVTGLSAETTVEWTESRQGDFILGSSQGASLPTPGYEVNLSGRNLVLSLI